MSAPPPYTEHHHHAPAQAPVITQQPMTSNVFTYFLMFRFILTFSLFLVPTQTVVLQTIQLGPAPTLMNCPNCLATITTTIDFEISGRTHLCALGLCLIGLWPCIPIPYLCCGGCCQRTVHTCPNCKNFIGSY